MSIVRQYYAKQKRKWREYVKYASRRKEDAKWECHRIIEIATVPLWESEFSPFFWTFAQSNYVCEFRAITLQSCGHLPLAHLDCVPRRIIISRATIVLKDFVGRSYFVERHELLSLYSYNYTAFKLHLRNVTVRLAYRDPNYENERALVRDESWRGVLSQTPIRESRRIIWRQKLYDARLTLNTTLINIREEYGINPVESHRCAKKR